MSSESIGPYDVRLIPAPCSLLPSLPVNVVAIYNGGGGGRGYHYSPKG